MAEMVYIVHDDIDALGGPVSRKALEVAHAPKGWREATDDEVERYQNRKREAEAKSQALTAEEVDAVRKRADLDELALLRGVDPTLHDNMESLRDAVKATL